MNRTEIQRRLQQIRIPLLIMALSLLILLGTGKGGSLQESADRDEIRAYEPVTLAEEEQRLAETLQMIDGVGETSVLLSIRVSAQTEYLSDAEKTVILSVGSGKQQALAFRMRGPEYLGAVIVCEGGDDPKIQWSVLEAVKKFTGLRADQITVLKYQNS